MKPPLGECRSCGAGVYWALTVSGKPMPINPTPTVSGNIVLRQDDDRWTAVVRSSADPLARYMSHFATCPHWRRGRAAGSQTGRPIDTTAAGSTHGRAPGPAPTQIADRRP